MSTKTTSRCTGRRYVAREKREKGVGWEGGGRTSQLILRWSPIRPITSRQLAREIETAKTMYEIDSKFAPPMLGYESIHEYYGRSSREEEGEEGAEGAR